MKYQKHQKGNSFDKMMFDWTSPQNNCKSQILNMFIEISVRMTGKSCFIVFWTLLFF